MDDTSIIILAKAPVPGFAKTRLSKDLGVALTHSIYTRLLTNLFQQLKNSDNVSLHVTPWEQKELFYPMIKENWCLEPQVNGSLGDKILAATSLSFNSGYSKALIIGSDCPDLRFRDLIDAQKKLTAARFVCGPTNDGGYWLIGLQDKPGWESIFQNITWSSNKVFRETYERAQILQPGHFEQLEVKSDLDTYEDWVKFKNKPEFAGLDSNSALLN